MISRSALLRSVGASAVLLASGCSTSTPTPKRTTSATSTRPSKEAEARAELTRLGIHSVEVGGEIFVQRARPALVVGNGDRGQALVVAKAIAQWVGQAASAVGKERPERLLVLAPKDDATVAQWGDVARVPGTGDAATLHRGDGPWLTVSPRVASADYPYRATHFVVRHELLHVLCPVTGDPPMWLQEGVPQMHAYGTASMRDPEAPASAHLPTDDEFDSAPQQAYYLAAHFCRYLREHRGKSAVYGLFADVMAGQDWKRVYSRRIGGSVESAVAEWRKAYPAVPDTR